MRYKTCSKKITQKRNNTFEKPFSKKYRQKNRIFENEMIRVEKEKQQINKTLK